MSLVITFTNESIAESIKPQVKSILGSWKSDQPWMRGSSVGAAQGQLLMAGREGFLPSIGSIESGSRS